MRVRPRGMFNSRVSNINQAARTSDELGSTSTPSLARNRSREIIFTCCCSLGERITDRAVKSLYRVSYRDRNTSIAEIMFNQCTTHWPLGRSTSYFRVWFPIRYRGQIAGYRIEKEILFLLLLFFFFNFSIFHGFYYFFSRGI